MRFGNELLSSNDHGPYQTRTHLFNPRSATKLLSSIVNPSIIFWLGMLLEPEITSCRELTLKLNDS